MASNEEHRQVEVASELEELARTLAHSTRTVPVPADSYALLGELRATTDGLEQVCRQLSRWHSQTVDGVQYVGEDDRGDGASGTVVAAHELGRAAVLLAQASEALTRAHSANGVIRWRSSVVDQ